MQAQREILKACTTILDMLLNIFVKGTPVGVSFAFRKTGADKKSPPPLYRPYMKIDPAYELAPL